MRVSQSDLVQSFYLHYNLPDVFMDFRFFIVFFFICFKNIQLLITTIVLAVLIVMAV